MYSGIIPDLSPCRRLVALRSRDVFRPVGERLRIDVIFYRDQQLVLENSVALLHYQQNMTFKCMIEFTNI